MHWTDRMAGSAYSQVLVAVRAARRAPLPDPFLPQISPNGRWMLFGDSEERLVVQRRRTRSGGLIGAPRIVAGVTYSSTGTAAAWSPDSAHLVIAGWVGNEQGLWIVHRDGSHQRRIVDDAKVEVEGDVDQHAIPAWSAKGGIAFVGSPVRYADGYLWAIYVVAPDGSGLRAVTKPVRKPVRGRFYGVLDSAPSWSPDGRRLVYAHDVFEEGSGALRSLMLATGVERRLGHAGASPVWSPDGRQIAFLSAYTYQRSVQAVGVIPSRGGSERLIRAPGISGYFVDLHWRSR